MVESQTGFGRRPGLGYPSKWADSRMPLPESAISTANAKKQTCELLIFEKSAPTARWRLRILQRPGDREPLELG